MAKGDGNGNGLYGVEIISQAPARLSMAGGGTDVSPYPEQFGGEVVNATISIFMLARLRMTRDPSVIIRANTRPMPMVYPSFKEMAFDGQLDFVKAAAKAIYDGDDGFELFVYSSLPMRSGLGGSGAMCVAVLGAFNAVRHGSKLNNYDLAELAYKIETVHLGNASGRQDQYAAAFGGFNHFEFLGGNHVRTHPVEISRAGERMLNQALLLFWVGERKASGGIIEKQRQAMMTGGKSLDAFHVSRKCVAEMREALQEVDVERIGVLLHLLWQQKKRFSSDVSNPAIDAIYERLREAGMIGGKITGAGGGGHMVACCPIEKRDAVLEAAAELKIRHVPFAFVQEGQISWQAPLRMITRLERAEPAPPRLEPETSLQPALFLDRDGVIVREINYLSSPSQMELIPGAAESIARVNAAGVPVIVVTNQAAIARGYFPEARLSDLHGRLNELLARHGAHVDRYYYCPHHPTEGVPPYNVVCSCRKPNPGLLLRAAEEKRIDLRRSFLVGDKLTDLDAGARAGTRTVLVNTGYGRTYPEPLDRAKLRLACRAEDLAAAVRFCLPLLMGPAAPPARDRIPQLASALSEGSVRPE